MNFKKTAFTLAEVLIATALIGVFTVLTISTMKLFKPDKEKMMYRKVYQQIETTVQNMLNDERLYPYDENQEGFANADAIRFDGEEYGANAIKDDDGNIIDYKDSKDEPIKDFNEGKTRRQRKFLRLFKKHLSITSSSASENEFQTENRIKWYFYDWDPSDSNNSAELRIFYLADEDKGNSYYRFYISKNGNVTVGEPYSLNPERKEQMLKIYKNALEDNKNLKKEK
ncbi:MAG: hypothetical protein K6A44_00030 [bacterium]|nr:hypothetical protein [bacterium]